MKLIRTHPFSINRVSDFEGWFRHPLAGLPSLSSFINNLGEAFPGVAGDKLAVDVHEDKDNYFASFEVPGVKKEDVKLELNNGLLTVSAEKRTKDGEKETSSSLTRSVSVPDGVNAEAIAAKLTDGILTVTLPKQERNKPRSITLS